MRIKIFLSVSAIVLLVAACNKKNTITEVPGVKVRTSTMTLPGPAFTDTFQYNIDGSLQSRTRTNGAKTIYLYSSSSVLENYYDATGSMMQATMYYLNSEGLADSDHVATGSPIVYTSHRYSYDADHHMVSKKYYDGTGALTETDAYSYTNGNEVTVTQTDALGALLHSFSNTYNTSLANTISGNHLGMTYLGTYSANLLSQQVVTTASSSATSHWSYQTDSHGYVSSYTVTDSSGTPTIMMGYTYY